MCSSQYTEIIRLHPIKCIGYVMCLNDVREIVTFTTVTMSTNGYIALH